MPIIRTQKLSKHFQEHGGKKLPVLRQIDLAIEPGEFFLLLGPSGAGKSTLLRILSGLESYEGSLEYAPGIHPKDFSFVFQHFALLPWLTVEDNVGLGLMARRIEARKRREIVHRELKLFGLEKFSGAFPRELSGGMRQRVGIARALATDPKIIFMDEPFSELDSFTAQKLRMELLSIWQERKMTIIMVSHQIDEGLELADRIGVLTPRPATLEKIYKNDLPRPRDKRSHAFFNFEDQIYEMLKP